MVPWRPQERVKGRSSTVRTHVDSDEEAPWAASHLPLFPVIEHGERLTATDLLGWWFRPPRRHEQAWDSFFEASERPQQGRPDPSEPPESAEEQSVDLEVGAGIFHPAIFLRVLGPVPPGARGAQLRLPLALPSARRSTYLFRL